MKLVKVTSEFYKTCEKYGANQNKQLLESEAGRPCVLILSLKYLGKKRKFVVPIKSILKHLRIKRIISHYRPIIEQNQDAIMEYFI